LYFENSKSPVARTLRHHDSTFVQTVDIFWSYRVTVSALTTAGLLLWLARSTVWNSLTRTISGIQMLLL